MKSISMDFLWIFDALARNAPKEGELILNTQKRSNKIDSKSIKTDYELCNWKSILVPQQVSDIKKQQFSFEKKRRHTDYS